MRSKRQKSKPTPVVNYGKLKTMNNLGCIQNSGFSSPLFRSEMGDGS